MKTNDIRKGLSFAAAALLVAAASAARAEYDSASRWIWGAAEAHSHETYSFRAAFDVPGAVRRASIKVYVDDGALYWLNGTSFSRNSIVDGNGLQQGRNVLAMLATNHVSKAGIILRGDIELTDGRHVIVNSDAQTLSLIHI